MADEHLVAQIERLQHAWASGDPADPGLRSACAVRLDELRSLYRVQPAAFAPEMVLTLRRVAESLRNPPPRRPVAESARAELKATFGYDAFRPGQEPIISAVLAGRDCIGIMPTGAGKSLTYQLPARLLGGTTLVISPLIALMKDQVDALTEVGIRATFLNSSVDGDERARRLEALWAGAYEVVYAAPEGLAASVGKALARVQLSLIAVDEAHCISQWGHDFRPAYRNLAGLKKRFGHIPILALTATATPEVVRDIGEQLGMVEPAEYRGSFFRKNLRVSAYKKGGEEGLRVRDTILRLIRARSGQSGIVYCLSRKSVEGMAEHLAGRGIKARAYHAGMESGVRATVQDQFRRDEVDVIVATVAFGMGIDKPNIRYVIHRDMPRSIEGYYQEIGRAGRDGVPSDCVLFYSYADVANYERFADESSREVSERMLQKVREMYRLADGYGCRHQALVGYLGQKIEPCATSCDVCARFDVVAAAPELPRGRARGASRRESYAPDLATAEGDKARPAPQSDLFERLRALRKRLADGRGVPAYFVFSDAVLVEMAAKRPATEADLLDISGVGPKKLAAYGAAFLEVLSEP